MLAGFRRTWAWRGGGSGRSGWFLGGGDLRGNTLLRDTSLDEIAVLVNWAKVDRLLASISASAKGEPGWPSLALVRALLLGMWHDLSDMRLP